MAGPDVWPIVDAERGALAADLDGVDAAAWDKTSLCTNWSVRDVVAHMTATAKMSGPRFFAKMVGSGFSLTRLQTKDIAAERGASPAETLAHFTAQQHSHGRPPGPVETILGETLVHAEDVRRPLGIAHEYPTDALARVAEFYAGSNLIIGGKRRVEGITMQATDVAWSHGDGPLVTGAILDLVLAMTGRRAALDALGGAGLETLAART